MSKIIRYGAGFVAVTGLFGMLGAIVAMIYEPQDRADIAVVVVIVGFGIYVMGHVAILGKPPAFLSWTSRKLGK